MACHQVVAERSGDVRPAWEPVCQQGLVGVSNGIRTRDILDHNQVLYQLSYTHHAPSEGD